MSDLRYPIGEFKLPLNPTNENVTDWIAIIASLPEKLSKVVERLNDTQLDTPYRDGGWTVRQVVHHLADSHINSYVRFKWTLTEDHPTIKAYNEKVWAEMNDARKAPVKISLDILEAVHKRWVIVLRNLSEAELQRSFHHPESDKDVKLINAIALYAWHCNHHLAHITSLCQRMNWNY